MLILLACPDEDYLFRDIVRDDLIKFFSDDKIDQYSTSFVVRYNVNNVPPKFTPDAKNRLLSNLVNKHADGINDFYPMNILDHDPQSQKGLAAMLKIFMDRSGVAKSPGYTGLLMDTSLYWSTLKLMYSVPKLIDFRNETYLSLGIWHAYPQGYRVIWQTWLNVFIGQLFLFLWPSAKIFKKPKHQVFHIYSFIFIILS